MSLKSLTWHQVNMWRMSQHFLLSRLKRRELVEAVRRTGGIQAQVMSAAEMAIGARVDGITPKDVQAALWEERTLIKTWAMRGTLHLLAANDLPLYVAARSISETRDWLKYFLYFGTTEKQYQAVLAAVPEVLGDEPMTREQLANAVAKEIGAPEVGKILLASSWGSLWKPSAWRGELCFGPSQGQNVTFVNPHKWIGPSAKQKAVEPQAAFEEIGRRYLSAYGPSTPEDFTRWWDGGSGLRYARKLFKAIESELEEVDMEGRRAWALSSTGEAMQTLEKKAEGPEVVRLLPLFDAYTLGLERDLEQLLPGAYKIRVFRPQGWITAVVLVDGRMKGVWEYKTGRARTVVKVRMFAPPTASIRKGIEAEVERLSAFLGSEVAVEFEGD
jgi:DNA glycosylase AlkZ-like